MVAHSEQLDGHGAASLAGFLAVLRRRKWVAIAAVVLAPAVAVALSLRQAPLYEASAEVLLSRQNLASTLTGTQDPWLTLQADRLAETEADLARVPTVAERTLRAAGVTDMTASEFLASSTVSASQDSDILTFTVQDESPVRAAALATDYAQSFTQYRLELDTAALTHAREELDSRVAELEQSGQSSSALYAGLVDKQQQLRTLEALQTANASVVRTADDAVHVRPKPIRNGLIAFALGAVLGVGLAFLFEALDTRVRRAQDVEQRLGLPLLGRLPEPPGRLRKRGQLAMIAEPTGEHAEAFRMLRQNLEFVSLEREAPRTVMVTSALPGEGKSTTAANLGVALARAGEAVVLADVDLRGHSIDSLFRLQDRPGLTDVALGRLELERALVPIGLPAAGSSTTGLETDGAGNGHARLHGVLEVLTSGPPPPDVGEFVASDRLREILQSLWERADHVIIDAPPLLGLGDALTLASRVDALIVVTRLKMLRRGTLSELHRVLEQVPAAKLGFVVTDAAADTGYGYRYGYRYGGAYGRRASRAERRQRVA